MPSFKNLLQKVIRRRILHRSTPCLVRRGIENLKALSQVLVQLQYARHVATPVAVIWSTPHRHQRVREHAPVSLHDQLVRPRDEVQVVPFVEHGYDVSTKQVPGPTWTEAPPIDLLGIGPHEIAHGAIVGNLLLAVDNAYLIQSVDAGTEPAVDGKYLVLDDGREGKVVEDFGAVPPDVDAAKLAEALVVEAVDLGDLSALVVATDEGDAVGISYLQREEEKESFDTVVTTVDEVSEEEVVFVGTFASDFKEFDQVVELAMDISAYRNRSIDPLNIAFVHQYFPGAQAQRLDLVLAQILASFQTFDLRIQGGGGCAAGIIGIILGLLGDGGCCLGLGGGLGGLGVADADVVVVVVGLIVADDTVVVVVGDRSIADIVSGIGR
mmetsp:Transcript_2475/g.5709  ORF Transcript_2475/g.5709 Transcript_2475/m.5709 type:complete len:382 (+) Transcript_2475:167-1312(+)